MYVKSRMLGSVGQTATEAPATVLTTAESILTADEPVWLTVLIAGGCLFLAMAIVKAVKKEARKAKKAVGR